ncbi:enterobactin/ferric enterobactin esterase [compost metagenome]
MDRLIFNKKVPPLLCVFIDPASIGPGYPYYGGTDNRSFEYDTASIDYANFLTNEVIIELKNRFSISDSPDDRAIMGASSGGVAAFGVAWHRPDQFRKVISSIGSYVNIRGGDAYIDLVRKTEKKPLKIYLQDGINDLNTIFGDWRLANEQLASSLAYRDYNFIFTQGNGGHNYVHLSEVIEPALIWIWSN